MLDYIVMQMRKINREMGYCNVVHARFPTLSTSRVFFKVDNSFSRPFFPALALVARLRWVTVACSFFKLWLVQGVLVLTGQDVIVNNDTIRKPQNLSVAGLKFQLTEVAKSLSNFSLKVTRLFIKKRSAEPGCSKAG